MREEISEPQQWRSHSVRNSAPAGLWMSRQKGVKGATNTLATLPREAIDEAFAEQPIVAESIRGSRRDLTGQHRQERIAVAQQAFSAEKADLLHNISTQLEMLKKQQEHLQRLLDQAQSS